MPSDRPVPVDRPVFRWRDAGAQCRRRPMTDPLFFRAKGPLSLPEVLALTGAKAGEAVPSDLVLTGVAPLDVAGPGDVSFLDNPRYLSQLDGTAAGLVLIAPKFAGKARPDLPLAIVAEPYRAFATVALALFPAAS